MRGRERLDNADDNVCFGCGPTNPMGLRLEFWRDGDVVTTSCTPTTWWSGQPGVVNPGILYAVLVDLVAWTAGAILHRVPLMPVTREQRLADVATSRPFAGRASVIARDGPRAVVRAELSQDGDVRCVLVVETRAVTREEYRKARPLVEIPESLAGYFEGE